MQPVNNEILLGTLLINCMAAQNDIIVIQGCIEDLSTFQQKHCIFITAWPLSSLITLQIGTSKG